MTEETVRGERQIDCIRISGLSSGTLGGIGLWKVPQLWKSATQRADSHTGLNGPHNPQPIHTYTQARRFIHIRGGIVR